MRRLPRPVLLLHSDPGFRGWLIESSGPGYHVSPVADWEELRRAVGSASPAATVVVGPYAEGFGRSLAAPLPRLIRDFASVPVVAALDLRPDRALDLRALADVGCAGVIRIGEESPTTLRNVLRAVQSRRVRRLLDRALPVAPAGRVRAILEAAAMVATTGGTAADLAAMFRTTERTVLRWCVGGALPPPRRLLAWMRVLVASALMDERERTLGSIAQVCGYSFDGALRKAVKSLVGVAAGDLREQEAFETTARAFAAELSRLRPERHHLPGGSVPAWPEPR